MINGKPLEIYLGVAYSGTRRSYFGAQDNGSKRYTLKRIDRQQSQGVGVESQVPTPLGTGWPINTLYLTNQLEPKGASKIDMQRR